MKFKELIFFVVFVSCLLIPDIAAKQWMWVGMWSSVILVVIVWELITLQKTGHTLSQLRWISKDNNKYEAWINAAAKMLAIGLLCWHLLAR